MRTINDLKHWGLFPPPQDFFFFCVQMSREARRFLNAKLLLFFESIPIWAITLIGGLIIWVLTFIMILTVYGRFFKLYMYTAIAPIPLSTFAGEPTQNIGKSFLRSYAGVCLEGAIIVLACIIFAIIARTNPDFDEDLTAAAMVWQYIGQVVFNMLILTGTIKLSDRIVKEMMGL